MTFIVDVRLALDTDDAIAAAEQTHEIVAQLVKGQVILFGEVESVEEL